MSSYRGDLSPSDREDIESFRPQTCPRCKGRGFIPVRGEAMAANPCGCDEEDDA